MTGNLPRFIAAKVDRKYFSFRIVGVMGTFLELSDVNKIVKYYDTVNEVFLTIERTILDLRVIDPERYIVNK